MAVRAKGMMSYALRNVLIGVATLGIVAWVALWCGCFGSTSYTADSVCYLRMAECIKGNTQGDGWFAIWPVGYPAVLAVASAVTGLDGFIASKLVSVLATAGLLGLFWKYARPHFPILALSLVNLAYLKIYRSTLSEHLFIPILVWIVFILSERLRKECAWNAKGVFGFAALLIAAYFTRYFGFLVPAWCVAVAGANWLRRRTEGSFLCLAGVACSAVVAWMADGGYMIVNRIMSGSASGYARGHVSETASEMLRMIVSAEIHEMQAYGILAAILVAMLALRIVRSVRFAGDERAIVFIAMGGLYHLSMLLMRSVRSFDALGFRLLYPGTVLIVIGLVLCLRVAWCDSGCRMRMFAFSLALVLLGSHLLEAELYVRRHLGIKTYSLGAPYPVLKGRVLGKFENVPHGATLTLPDLATEDYMLKCLRPDIHVKVLKY